MSALLFKGITRGIPICPLGGTLVPNSKIPKQISKFMVSYVFVKIFKIILYHKINRAILRDPPLQIPIIILWDKRYQSMLGIWACDVHYVAKNEQVCCFCSLFFGRFLGIIQVTSLEMCNISKCSERLIVFNDLNSFSIEQF
jgi:hypothetical protein